LDEKLVAHALITLIFLFGIWFLVFKLYRDAELDWFRDIVFVLRNELFDYAADGNIDFDHPAYTMLRGSMNAFLRFGHRISLVQLITLSLIINRNDSERSNVQTFSHHWAAAASQLEPEIQQKLIGYRYRLNLAIASHVLLGSPELVCTLVVPAVGVATVVLCRSFAAWIFTQLARVLHNQLDDIGVVAAIYGEQNSRGAVHGNQMVRLAHPPTGVR